MSVHYKFKSALDFDTVSFDGLNISVGDLKRAIIHQKRLGKATDFDLQITNAQTKEEYQDDNTLIPKNTSLIIARIPITHQPRKLWNPQNSEKAPQTRASARVDGTSLDLSKMKGSEEDKILEMMIQSTADYDPKSYHRLRGHSQVGEVPPTYRCNKCKKGGHWIKNCPYTLGKDHMEVKRNTGIPRSFLDKDDKELLADFPEPGPAVETKKEIPEDLICSICKDLFVDAVMIPCCGSSFCDDCVRTALLESEDNECPDCKEKGSSPGSLIPNRFLRNSVNAFKNENGYITHSKKASEDKTSETGGDILKLETVDLKELPYADETPSSIVQIEQNKSDKHPSETDTTEINHNIDRSKTDDIESDYEDNITIMMPPVQVKSPCRFREQPFSGRNTNHPKPPGIESSPHHSLQVSPLHSQRTQTKHNLAQSKNVEWEHDYKPEREYTEENDSGFYKGNSLKQYNSHQSNVIPHYSSNKVQMRPSRPVNLLDVYSGPPNRGNTYQQMPPHPSLTQDPSIPGPPITPYSNVYNQPGQRQGVGYQHSARPIFHNVPGYPSERCSTSKPHQIITTSNLASVYQGVAAKVGTGIIEDPLETFNRLMREKERRREDRRRSIEYRRSRSHDRQQRSRYHNSPYRRTSREVKEKPRPRDSDRKHDNGLDRNRFSRHRRSVSCSDRSSRSRSWSNSSHKKRSKSPYSRRSRSRTYNTGDKRSTSQEKSHSHHNADWNSHRTSFQISGDKYKNVKKERFQEISETVEPPPPGFEWNQPSISVSQEDNNRNTKRNTPDLKELKTYDTRRSLARSPSKSSNRNSEKKRKLTRSTSPTYKKQSVNFNRREKSNYKKPRLESESRKSSERKRDEHNGKEIKNHSRNQKRHPDDSVEKHGKINSDTVSKNDKKVDHVKPEKYEKEISPELAVKSNKLDSKLVVVDREKQNTKVEMRANKKMKDRKKRRREKIEKKDKIDRRKLKKDKRNKREKDKQKNEEEHIEQKSSNETEFPRTPDIQSYENTAFTKELPSAQHNNSSDASFFAPDREGADNSNDDLLLNIKLDDKKQTLLRNKRVDSVLDIHDYETNFDELNSKAQKLKEISSVPELSKWEREEQNNSNTETMTPIREDFYKISDKDEQRVTNEVLRKAENAIFSRAIKAVHSHVDDDTSEEQKGADPLPKIGQNAPKDMKNFEITVPTRNSQERSVQIRNDTRQPSRSPILSKSVKERLGNKIFSRQDHSPQRHSSTKSSVSKRETDYHSKRQSPHDRCRDDRDKNKYKEHDKGTDYKSSRIHNRGVEISRREKHTKKRGEDSPRYQNPLRHRSDVIGYNFDKDKKRITEKIRVEKKQSEVPITGIDTERTKHMSGNENVSTFNRKSNPRDKPLFQSRSNDNSQIDCPDRRSKLKSHIKDVDSCSVSVDSSSDSETESSKRKKKHKYKKDKKRSKRSLSAESSGSLKEKHVKSKKRNKSSKRKKKSKK